MKIYLKKNYLVATNQIKQSNGKQKTKKKIETHFRKSRNVKTNDWRQLIFTIPPPPLSKKNSVLINIKT